jgi:glutamyl-tRNA reductase
MLVAPRDSPPLTASATTLVALVAHARSVPSAVREAFGRALGELPEDPRRLVIRTCHRVELYAVAQSAPDGSILPPGAERLEDAAAVEHLLSVACGLDSAVFGETQILHQLREALEERRLERALDPVLDRLLQAGLRTGREARASFTGPPRSLADVALDRIEAGTGRSLAGRSVLVIGAGRMARLATFAAHRRDARLLVANRTPGRAVALAAEVAGEAIPFDAALPIDDVAGVVIAINGAWPLDPASERSLLASGAVIVDLSSPPALDPALSERLGSAFVSVDHLASTGEAGPDERIRARLERLISQAGGDYCGWLRARGSVPAIRAVVGAAESRRAEELARLRRRLPELTEDELAAIEQMSHRLVSGILHAPLKALTSDEDGALEPAARELFGL